MVLLRQLSYAIKNQLVASKAPCHKEPTRILDDHDLGPDLGCLHMTPGLDLTICFPGV